MRALLLAALTAGALGAVAPASADPGPVVTQTYAPPFVARVAWVQWGQRTSLRVYPTPSGRAASRQLGSQGPDADEAWAEVLAQAPTADTPGMREQFRCHWDFAETAEPGKTSWNLEPWRPVVDDATMVGTGCNPGGGGESF